MNGVNSISSRFAREFSHSLAEFLPLICTKCVAESAAHC